jgi:hypothetical protein
MRCKMDVRLQTDVSYVIQNALCTAVCLSESVKLGEGWRMLWENDFLFKQNS